MIPIREPLYFILLELWLDNEQYCCSKCCYEICHWPKYGLAVKTLQLPDTKSDNFCMHLENKRSGMESLHPVLKSQVVLSFAFKTLPSAICIIKPLRRHHTCNHLFPPFLQYILNRQESSFGIPHKGIISTNNEDILSDQRSFGPGFHFLQRDIGSWLLQIPDYEIKI